MTYLRIFWALILQLFRRIMGVSENILTNIDKVAYTTYFDTDLVVKTFTGKFTYGTGTVTLNYTYATLPNNQQALRLVHGFDRPVFVEAQWSLDNDNFSVGGGSAYDSTNFAIGFSDSTYIYLMLPYSGLSSGTTIYYKMVCSWIPNYDDTNPSVPPFAEIPSTYTQTFNSRITTPAIVRQGVMNLSTTSGSFTNVIGVVKHPFGYAPNMKVFIEAFSGEVWPLNFGGTSNPYGVDDNQVEAEAFTTTTDFAVEMRLKSSLGARKVWYMLYGKNTDTEVGAYSYGQSSL